MENPVAMHMARSNPRRRRRTNWFYVGAAVYMIGAVTGVWYVLIAHLVNWVAGYTVLPPWWS